MTGFTPAHTPGRCVRRFTSGITLWSNQVSSTFYFATHRDGDPHGTWTSEGALSSPQVTADHMNLKQLEAMAWATSTRR